MTKYAVIENGKITNTVVATADVAQQRGWVLCPNEAGIGWDYVNGQFIDNRPVPAAPVQASAPTKEELLAQLQALQSQIQALE